MHSCIHVADAFHGASIALRNGGGMEKGYERSRQQVQGSQKGSRNQGHETKGHETEEQDPLPPRNMRKRAIMSRDKLTEIQAGELVPDRMFKITQIFNAFQNHAIANTFQ
eukprot:TRINITY_DN94772_c0_g1_i1.p1 TRINITY_DN94772_c0_g1~~TRINITY_DN94772_c0_g1_i1.p1  ORF type:complete len:123 (+),score=2.68 TRINITY_DN94772_c0_g1_i1:42-371(+)